MSIISELKKNGKDFEEIAAVQTRDREKTGCSEDEMDTNTLNSWPAVLCEPKKGLELVTDETEPYHVPFSLYSIQTVLHPCSLLAELRCC